MYRFHKSRKETQNLQFTTNDINCKAPNAKRVNAFIQVDDIIFFL